MVSTIVLFDCGGKIEAALFGSRREAFKLERVGDQMGMIAVKVTTTPAFDANSDYLIRQVSKNNGISNQLIFGDSSPKWAGGELLAPRLLLDTAVGTSALLDAFPAQNWKDSEIRRQNGISNRRADDNENDNCNGK